MDELFSEMLSKGLISIGQSQLTIPQAISYAFIKKCDVDYLQRDKIDWQDWLRWNMN